MLRREPGWLLCPLQVACTCAVVLAGCARSELLPLHEHDAGGLVDAIPDATALDGAEPTLPDANPADAADACVAVEESCNGLDDDCDGVVDELSPIPCPGGGSRFCVAGRLSECPTRCEVCRPGAQRVCFLSYCTFWASQTCAADGRSFSGCREQLAPPECEHLIEGSRPSRALEQCCLDNGYCCVDYFDLNGDGSTHDMLGRCEDVSCD